MVSGERKSLTVKRSAAEAVKAHALLASKRKLCEIQVKETMPTAALSPSEVAFELFQENGFNMKDIDLFEKIPFVKPTPEMINGYQQDKINLVRSRDLEGIRALHNKGESFDCCNRFGESLIHMACRRSCTDLVEFLVREVKVSIFVRDDYGRTPVHDAFWTVEPNFELVALLINEIPEFLCLKDIRGHTPLDYVRKGDWEIWCDFLRSRKDSLVPRFCSNDNKKKRKLS